MNIINTKSIYRYKWYAMRFTRLWLILFQKSKSVRFLTIIHSSFKNKWFPGTFSFLGTDIEENILLK